jgi:hypothetical protein
VKKKIIEKILYILKEENDCLDLLMGIEGFQSLLIHNGFNVNPITKKIIPEKYNKVPFSVLRKALYAKGFSQNGVSTNKKDYVIVNASSQEAYEKSINFDVDENKAVEAILKYYSETENPLGLTRFFLEDLFFQYYNEVNKPKKVSLKDLR